MIHHGTKMNYLHHHANFDWTGAHSYRACDAMTFIHEIYNLKGKHHITDSAISTLSNLVKQHKERKVRWWQPKLGKLKIANNVIDINKSGYLTIDGRELAFDTSLMYWFISEYNFDWIGEHAVIVDIMYTAFKNVHDDIIENYEFYCSNENSEIRLEKLLCMYLTAKSGMEITDKKYTSYDDIPRYTYQRNGVFNEEYLLAEDMINQIKGTNYTFAHEEFDERYNKEISKGISDMCKTIVNGIKK